MFKLPLAWLQLVRQRVRFLVTLSGITFIVVLMFVQVGFRDALYSSATQVHQILQGDLFLVSSQYKSLTSSQSFPRVRLYQALGFNGVEFVSPLYLQFAKFKNPINGEKYSIYVIGFDLGKPILGLTEIEQNLDKLRIPEVVLFDRKSRQEFGPIAMNFERGNTEQEVEIFSFTANVGYRVKIGGLFSLGPSFGVDGNIITSDSTFLRLFRTSGRRPGRIDIGSILLKPGIDSKIVLANMRANLPEDVQVFDRETFIQFEKDYWSARTPIGYALNLMLTMGSVVGVVVVYQILYSNISNHLTAFATLKAVGYRDRYFTTVILQQALIFAVLGYVPGLIISFGLYDIAGQATRLPMVMDINRMVLILMAAILMCFTSGVFAMGKLRSADPADIF